MGILGGVKTVYAIERLKTGKSQKEAMSISDVVDTVVNLSDAQAVLPREQYLAVMDVYNNLKRIKEKKPLTLDDYIDATTLITFMFDHVAPYELFCGSPEIATYTTVLKANPDYEIMRDMIIENPSILKETRNDDFDYEEAMKKYCTEHGIDYASDEDDEDEDVLDIEDSVVHTDCEDVSADYTDEEHEDIEGHYKYEESYVFFKDKGSYSEAFDADLFAVIFLNEDSKCTVTIEQETYEGQWAFTDDEQLDFEGFSFTERVFIRGITSYYAAYSDEQISVIEDDPQMPGISFKHIFTKLF